MIELTRRRRRNFPPFVVGPPAGFDLPVALLRAIGADDDHLHAVLAGLEGAHRGGRDAHHIPLADVEDDLADLEATRAAGDDVDLFLDLMVVADGRPEARRDPESADAEVLA